MKNHHYISILILFFVSPLFGQTVGIVLSGGGAAGFAHIGVLKALEENNIPIDYITGTSSGSLVGAMYACGYTPKEIEAYVLSERFLLMTRGEVEQNQEFLLRENSPDAGSVSFSISLDSLIKKSLPTNFIRPELLDYEMMRIFGTTSASKQNNFDNLFVPFRCVASDIVAKRGVVFDKGKLNQVVRASMTYPFFINPIRIDGVLYFDGGLYNNFPSDVMYTEFYPDFIIGSNVSYNAAPPSDDDLIGQLTNMLVTYTNFSIPCDDGILIRPTSSVSTFDFEEVETAIKSGYDATIAQIEEIKKAIVNRVTAEELAFKRAEFKKSIVPLTISEVNTSDKQGSDESYVRKSILKNAKGQRINEETLEKRYFRTYATPQTQYLFPTISLKPDSTYKLEIDVTKSKALKVDIGGIVSSRAINTGFVQLTYLRQKRIASAYRANSYFGKFYGSGKVEAEWHLPSYYPISFGIYGTGSRYDYFRNFATFFEDSKPSFLVQYETFIGAQFKIPVANNSKSTLDFKYFSLDDTYYQDQNFTNKDTTDETRFQGTTITWSLEQNSLNRKQWANSGTYFGLKFKAVNGKEHSISGSTAVESYDYRKNHQWINMKAEFQSFLVHKTHFSLGIHALGSITSQSLLKNYTATLLSMNAFQPLPDMFTYFLPEYRSPQFVGGGLNIVYTVRKNIDVRLDAYWYQPFKQIIKFDDGTFGYSKLFKGESQIASLSAIYSSPIGPVRLTLNYFPLQPKPIILQFTYGFILFNERATR